MGKISPCYPRSKCIICGEPMVHALKNYHASKEKFLSVIVHVDCRKGGNHGRMNDRIGIGRKKNRHYI